MPYVCEENKCTGCKACIYSCQRSAIHIKDTLDALNAVIDTERCIECKKCEQVCHVNKPPILSPPTLWRQGWSNNEGIRSFSASGGFATAIAVAFLKMQGMVVGCSYKNGSFSFSACNTEEDLRKLQGSKYVKSDPQNAFGMVKEMLEAGRKVLFIGLPCQVAAVIKVVPERIKQNLYTIDLICHGTPSFLLLDKYMNDAGYKLSEVQQIRFRIKSEFRVFDDYTPVTNKGVLDPYMFTFLRGMSYTENCYSCKFAGIERVSDITIGDSWGSTLEEIEQKKGISLALCQTEKGQELLKMADLTLKDVNIENAIRNNGQLNSPMKMPKSRVIFFSKIKKNWKYNVASYTAEPVVGTRQLVKYVLSKLKILDVGGENNQYTIIIK